MNSRIRTSVFHSALSAFAFALVLFTVSAGYGAFQSFSDSDYAYPRAGWTETLNATLWNKVIDNMVDLDSRLSSFTFSGGSVGIGILPSSAALSISWTALFDAGGDRPIRIGGGSGMITVRGSEGGWTLWYVAEGYSGSSLGGFGFLGSGDSLQYYYVGSSYSNPTITLAPNGGNVGIGTSPGESYRLSISGSLNATQTCLNGNCLSGWGDIFGGTFTTASTNCPALNNPKTGGQNCPSGYSSYISWRGICDVSDVQTSYTYVCIRN